MPKTSTQTTKENMRMRLNDMKNPLLKIGSDLDDTNKKQKETMIEMYELHIQMCELWEKVDKEWKRSSGVIAETKAGVQKTLEFTMTKEQLTEMRNNAILAQIAELQSQLK